MQKKPRGQRSMSYWDHIKYGMPMLKGKKLWIGQESAHTDGQRTDRRTDGRTDSQNYSYLTPYLKKVI